MVDAEWHAVRCIFDLGGTYEERITLRHVSDFEEAIEMAEVEAAEYASDLSGCEYAGLAQVYALSDRPGHGAEVFSLMRDSSLGTNDYLDAFFDAGQERQGEIGD